jgi:uncharacterized membrane protein
MVTSSAQLYDWLKFLHVVAAMVWVGGVVMLAVLVTRVLRDGDRDALQRFVGGLRVIGPLVLAPATVALFALGIWLVLDSAAWDFGQLWIQLALGLFAAVFLIGAAHQSRTAIAAQRATERGDADEAARQLRRWARGMGLILVLLIAATWDMVIKPGL